MLSSKADRFSLIPKVKFDLRMEALEATKSLFRVGHISFEFNDRVPSDFVPDCLASIFAGLHSFLIYV